MRTIKTLVFTTEQDHAWLKGHEDEIREAMAKTKNAKIAPFVYRYAPLEKPETFARDDGKVRIRQSWFDRTLTDQARREGFDTCVLHFTTNKRKEWDLHPTINGTYWLDDDSKFEFWLCADRGQRSTSRQIERNISQYVRVFLHEYAHGFIHFFHPDRREDVHTWDYNKRNIKGIYETIEAPKGEPIFIDKRYASDNYWTGNDPVSFMFHTTGGSSLEGAVQTLIARGLSYNYIIHRGKIYELVHWTNSAWHAGVVKQPVLRAVNFFKGENPNKMSVGVAFTYPADDISVLPDEDVDAAVKLMKHVGQQAGQRYNADNIFAHIEVTYDKPRIVLGYREQIIDALVGDKDEKDAGEKTRMKLLIEYLKLKIQLLLLRKKLNK